MERGQSDRTKELEKLNALLLERQKLHKAFLERLVELVNLVKDAVENTVVPVLNEVEESLKHLVAIESSPEL